MTETLDNLATLAKSQGVDFSTELSLKKKKISNLLTRGDISNDDADQLASYKPARLLIKWGQRNGLLSQTEAKEYLEIFMPK